MLRKGNAGSNTATDHIAVVKAALAQLPGDRVGTRPGRKVLIRTDGAGGTHEFVTWLVSKGLSYSLGFTLPDTFAQTLTTMPKKGWTPAYDADGQVRDGAWVADVTSLLELSSWPSGMRVLVRKERPHPGAQLRITDADGHRITALATNTSRGQLADLELRHRRRARCEDRIRAAKDTRLRNLPLHDFAQNQIGALWSRSPSRSRPGRRCSDSKITPLAGGSRTPTTTPVQHRRPTRRPRPTTTLGPLNTRTLGPTGSTDDHHAADVASTRLTSTHPPQQPSTTGPWNRRTERPRPNRHTPTAQSTINDEPPPLA